MFRSRSVSWKILRLAGTFLAVTAACSVEKCGGGGMDPTIPESLEVTPTTFEISVDDYTQISARVLGCDSRSLSDPVSWSSSNPAVASVDAVGVVTGRSEGSATIRAAVGSLSRNVAVTVIDDSPSVTIIAPANGSSFAEGTSITFSGSATDPQDGTLSGNSLSWRSSLDGQIGTGTSFSRSDLSTGSHTVTLTGTDSDGLSDSETVSITLLHDTNQIPTVTITQPGNGSSFSDGQTITFQGSANDPEDGTLSGASLVWTSSLDLQIGTGTSFTRNDLSTGSHTITLTATDSEGAKASKTVGIGIDAPPNQQPTATITAPANGSSFTMGTNISFQGSANDPEDGTLTGASLVWTSSNDGQIGTGTSFAWSTLSVGSHTITLKATDSGALTGSTSIQITITQPNQQPTATITAPASGSSFTEGTNISFQGSATDPEDGTLTGASLVWTSSNDGQIGTGTSFTWSNLSVGSHSITLKATDSDGATGSKTVALVIESSPPPGNLSGRIVVSIFLDTTEQGHDVWGLFSMTEQGGDLSPVTTTVSSQPFQASVSPDGNWIAYSYGTYIFGFSDDVRIRISNADGTVAYEIPASSHPSFSPDGSEVAYWGSSCNLKVVQRDGSNPRTVTTCPTLTDYANPGMSPQAWSLYVSSNRGILFDVNPLVVPAPNKIWITDSQSGGEQLVVDAGGTDATDAVEGSTGLVAYVRGEGTGRQIWLYSHLSKAEVQFTTDAWGACYDPAWKPGEQVLAFVCTVSGNPEIYTYDFSANETRQLTFTLNAEANPYWVD